MGRGEEHAARSRKRDLVQDGGHVRLRHVPDLLLPDPPGADHRRIPAHPGGRLLLEMLIPGQSVHTPFSVWEETRYEDRRCQEPEVFESDPAHTL